MKWMAVGLLACLVLGGCTASGAYSAPPRSDRGGPAASDSGAAAGEDASVPPADADPAPDADVDLCEALPRESFTLYLSADDSSSIASPAIARRMIRRGEVVPAEVLRTYEFLNYYNTRYAPADAGRVRVVPQMRRGSAPGELEFQVGVQSETRSIAAVRPMTITFVLDTSGSMGGDRIARERAVVRAIAGQLRAGDIVSAVTWDTGRRTVLDGHVVSGPNDRGVLAMAAGLEASGGTDLQGGLAAGYALARRHYAGNRLNRVVVISDGEANVGITDEELIAQESHRAEGEEIYLVGVGVGDGFNDTMMDTITDRGRGGYVYIDSDAEAQAVFGERFVELMDVAVRAVRLEVTLPWYLRVRAFHGEQISGDPREVDPQHLAPNDAMVFHQVLASCALEQLDLDSPITVRATYEGRDDRVAASETVQTTLAALIDGGHPQLDRGSAIVAYAEGLKAIGRALARGDRPAAQAALREAKAAVAAARAQADDTALREIAGLLEAYTARVE
jgi:Ca-activated chloride channel family protein